MGSNHVTTLLKKKTWSLVDPPPNLQIVSCTWVLRKKTDVTRNIIRFKAALVDPSFLQIPRIDFKDTFSPMLRSITFRLFVSLAVELDLELHHIDVQTAFLHQELEKEIICNHHILKIQLNQMLYVAYIDP